MTMVDNKKNHKMNCWEFKKCGLEPGGKRVDKLGVCPSALETRLAGIHGGSCGGRACWVIAGTFCGGESQGIFAKKYVTCKICDFYQQVMKEEGAGFQLTMNIMKYLKSKDR